ncbi:MAG: SMC-Scp complex subunit ScpB [Acidobacteriota bacterium]|nr:SMC-Scp complex subunit ScpB [Acidobacteriota bacterium]
MKASLKNIIESLIFVSLEPLSFDKIKSTLTEFQDEDIQIAINDLFERYSTNERGIQIIQVAGGLLFSTNPDYDIWIKRLLNVNRKNKLSPAALETISTIAYYQPITLAEISAIRGVDSTSSLKSLLQKRLIKIVGRKKGPGRPLIYRTSNRFLTYFGLQSISDLPSQEEITKILEDEKNSS